MLQHFGIAGEGEAQGRGRAATSKEAARQTREERPSQLKMIYEILAASNGDFTYVEVMAEARKLMNISERTVTARCSDLASAGCVEKGEKRPTKKDARGREVMGCTWRVVGPFTAIIPKKAPQRPAPLPEDFEKVKRAVAMLQMLPGNPAKARLQVDSCITLLQSVGK
ncbi:MAG: hypothetical protein AB7H77_09295 [Bdellovibrionales bacterium]